MSATAIRQISDPDVRPPACRTYLPGEVWEPCQHSAIMFFCCYCAGCVNDVTPRCDATVVTTNRADLLDYIPSPVRWWLVRVLIAIAFIGLVILLYTGWLWDILFFAGVVVFAVGLEIFVLVSSLF